MKKSLVIAVSACVLWVLGFAQNAKTDIGCEFPEGIESKEISYHSFYLQSDYLTAVVNKESVCPTPSWKPQTQNLPFTIGDALKKAQDFLGKTYEKGFLSMYALESVELKIFLKDKWYYVIRYKKIIDKGDISVVVLLNGRVLSTKTTKAQDGLPIPAKSTGTMTQEKTQYPAGK